MMNKIEEHLDYPLSLKIEELFPLITAGTISKVLMAVIDLILHVRLFYFGERVAHVLLYFQGEGVVQVLLFFIGGPTKNIEKKIDVFFSSAIDVFFFRTFPRRPPWAG